MYIEKHRRSGFNGAHGKILQKAAVYIGLDNNGGITPPLY